MQSRRSIPLLETLAVVALLFLMFVSGRPAFAQSNHSYTEDQTKLQGHMREIEELRERIHHLVAEKKHADEKSEVKMLVDQIAEAYKRLKKVNHDHEALWLHIRFKHPEQASSLEKKYTRFKLKSLEDMEAEVGIDGRLDRIKAKVLATFPAPQHVEVQQVETKVHPFYRKPASVEDDSPENITLSK